MLHAPGTKPVFHWKFDESGFVESYGGVSLPIGQHRFRVGDAALMDAAEADLPCDVADLLGIGRAVYVADRISRRPRLGREGRPRSPRTIELTIPVRQPERWNSSVVSDALSKTLYFYTEDEWRFVFVKRNAPPPIFYQPTLFPPAGAYSRVALFSGGLDSFAGLVAELARCPNDGFALATVLTSSRVQGRQLQLAQALRRLTRRQLGVFPFPVNLQQRSYRADHHEETSQRTRGFLFGIVGAVTAIMLEVGTVSIFENGIGCFNLPYTDAQIGVDMTRATNPLALIELSSLIRTATDRYVRYELPFLFTTKAEMCEGIRSSTLRDLIPLTISCDGFPQRLAECDQCGVCTSCLLRRQSLYASGMQGYDSARYRYDIFSPTQSIPEGKLFPLRAMLFQVSQVERLLSSAEPWRDIACKYPSLFQAALGFEPQLFQAGFEDKIVRLYRKYCSEWHSLPARLGSRSANLLSEVA